MYGLKYYKEIEQGDGAVIRIEFYKKGSEGIPMEIGPVIQELFLEIQGQQNDIDAPIIKSSLNITIVDANDLDNGQKNGFWEEFYTADEVEWKVLLFVKDNNSNSYLQIWGGYVTPDSYSEALTYRGSVNIIARDNIGHLQDFMFDAQGDNDGMISLHEIISLAWNKIESPMSFDFDDQVLSCQGVSAYDTLMNVSAFEGKTWYAVLESVLQSYCMVLRYVGYNRVVVTSLRGLPNIITQSEDKPIFIAGATRELVPAVKKIVESVTYDHTTVQQKLVQIGDFSGAIQQIPTPIPNKDSTATVWPISNIEVGSGWINPTDKLPLYFNPSSYNLEWVTTPFTKEEERYLPSSMMLACNTIGGQAIFSKYIYAHDTNVKITFGGRYYIYIDDLSKYNQDFHKITAVNYALKVVKDGITHYQQPDGSWGVNYAELSITSEKHMTEVVIPISFEVSGQILLELIITNIQVQSYLQQVYVVIESLSFENADSKPLMLKNSVNTIYNDNNNLLLERHPEIAPSYNDVALPGFIKNGIFVKKGLVYSQTDEWSWNGNDPQQMAVYNHLQILSFYVNPNNNISCSIAYVSDLKKFPAIYQWHHKEHLLISGRMNFITGQIDGAVLRQFARYEDLWGEISGAALPDTEEKSTNDVENNASSRGSSSTYTNSTTINIGSSGGSGASYLNDLMDVNVEAATAQSVLFYTGNEWVPRSLSVLLGGYASKASTLAGYGITDAYTKGDIDGKITSINGVLTTHDNRIKSLEDMWYLENGVVKSKYPMMTKGYAAGATATADGGGGGIINKESIISALQYTPVNPADLGALATKDSLSYSDVGVTKDVVTSLIGPATYAPYVAEGYLSRNGGTISGQLNVSNINGYTPITSGNISSQSVAGANKIISSYIYSSTSKEKVYEIQDGAITSAYTVLASVEGMFPTIDNSNALLKISTYSGGKGSLLGFSNNGNLYYRLSNATAWKTIAFTDSDITGSAAGLKHSNGTVGATINSSGNVTIGASDLAKNNYKLWVNDSVRVSNGTYSDILEFDDNGGRITFWNGSYHAGTIEASTLTLNAATGGKVGIGTTSPAYKLDVNGKIRFEARTIWGQSFDGTEDVLAKNGVGLMSSKSYYGLSILPMGNPYWGVRTFLTYDEGDSMGAFEITARYERGLTISHGGGAAKAYDSIPSDLTYTSLVEIRPNGTVQIGTTTEHGANLQVNGTGRFTKAVTMDGMLNVGRNITIGGNVLIGTTADNGSGARLQVYGDASARLYRFSKSGLLYGYIGLASANDNDITISTDSSSKLWLNGFGNTIMNCFGGNVLIGTNQDNGAKLQVNGGISIASGYTLKIGDATISYVNGVLKVDKPFMAKGYAAGATASVSSGDGGVVLNKESVIEALGYTPYDSANPNGYITASALSGYQLSSGLGSLAYEDSVTWSEITNKMKAGNEFNFIPSGINSSTVHFNYRCDDGSVSTTPISQYEFWDGTMGSYASLKGKSFIVNGGTSSQFLKADGSVDSTAYLPLVGGATIVGTGSYSQNILKVDTENTIASGIAILMNGAGKVGVGYTTTTAYGNNRIGAFLCNLVSGSSIGIKDDGTPYYNGNTLYHSGNFNPADYLPKAGGTITDLLFLQYTNPRIIFKSDANTTIGAFGYIDGYLQWFDAINLKYNKIIHSGNIASQSVAGANKLVTSAGVIAVEENDTGNLLIGQKIAKNNKDTYIYGNNIRFSYGTAGSITSTAMRINPSGNVLIGATEDNGAKLQVAGNFTCSHDTRSNIFYFTSNGEDKGWFGSPNNLGANDFVASVNDGNIRFNTNNSERMRIASGGNVGIGTTSPAYKLDVNGTANFSGAVTMSSTLSVGGNTTINGNTSMLGVLTLSSSLVTSGTIFLGNGNEGIYINRNEIAWHTDANGYKALLMSFSDTAITIAKPTTINGTLNVSSGNVIKIGDATISYENGVLKIDKPLMAKGYAAGATATAN